MFVRNGTGDLKKVLVSPPTYLNAAPINEIAIRWKDTPLDREKMESEFQQFLEAFINCGIETELLIPDPKRPNAVFARDFGGCIKEGFILGNFKFPLRYQEKYDYDKRMEELFIPKVCEIKKGLFEGGDFMYLKENLIALGMADRTDQAGYLEMREKLFPLGYEIIPVRINKKYLHLDMCFNLVDDHLAVGYMEGMPESFKKVLYDLDIETICVPEASIFRHGCNLQSLGKHRVLSLKQNERVNAALEKRGMEVIELDITEILKAGGGPHCMTFPLIRL